MRDHPRAVACVGAGPVLALPRLAVVAAILVMGAWLGVQLGIGYQAGKMPLPAAWVVRSSLTSAGFAVAATVLLTGCFAAIASSLGGRVRWLFIEACARGLADRADSLLWFWNADLDCPAPDGATPTVLAAESGSARIVRMLLKRRVAVDVRDGMGRTALMWAAWYGHGEVVRLLIGAGADVNAADGKGATVLSLAAARCRFEVIRLLVHAGARATP